MRENQPTSTIARTQECLVDDKFVRSIILRKVRRLIETSSFDFGDYDDLVQEVYARSSRSLELFNPTIGHLYPFVCTIVQRHLLNLLRDNSVAKKASGIRISLSKIVPCEDGASELSGLLVQDDQDRRLGRETRRSDQELAGIRLDLSTEIEKLPVVCQEIVRRLKTQNVSEISREMGIPRTTINDWLRQIRQQFDDAGLRAYLEE